MVMVAKKDVNNLFLFKRNFIKVKNNIDRYKYNGIYNRL